LIHAFKHGVLVGLSQIPRVPGRKQEPCRDLLDCLRDRQADVLRFTTDLRIPPTSNQAERDLRPAKTQQKISGRLRSEQATRDRYAIRGYISTVAKHGDHVMTAVRDALAGHPGMPPSPDLPETPPHRAPPCAIQAHQDVNVYAEPPFWAANQSKPNISQGTPIRSICTLTSSVSAVERMASAAAPGRQSSRCPWRGFE